MFLSRVRPALCAALALLALDWGSTAAQLTTGYRPIAEPGIYGVRIHPGALAPNRRKFYLPQNLFYEYGWRGWEYSNYARDEYERYVDIQLEGNRHYDAFGNYIARGWTIYDWTENNPLRQGSGIFKSPRYSSWFDRVVISSAHKGQFHTALTVGDAIRTTLTPLTFSKPTFNGIQWDFLADKYAFTFLGSRISSPANPAGTQSEAAALVENSTRLLGGRGVAQVGDFAKVGATWVSAHNARSTLDMGDNSLKGVLTTPQNTGSVETVTILISDDSPESSEDGALLFFDRVLIDGEIHPEITPIVRGGIRTGGSLEARGVDNIELIYDIRNSFRPTEKVPTYQEASKIEFELILANDYRVDVTSNVQTDRLGDPVFLPVAQAEGEISDGSNQQFLRFEYGLPTGSDLIGVDFEILSLGGLDLRAEFVRNRRFRRFPNQNLAQHTLAEDKGEAGYITASYTSYPWFAYGEMFTMDPDYSTTAFMANSLGGIDYSSEIFHLFEFVDDNDDQDRFADWQRAGQFGTGVGASGGSVGADLEVFPGLDENNDFVSDFNQNRNARPDYDEPFLRYEVDPPDFLFGMDMNNNTLIDRFEDDRQPDYPYDRDHRGYNAYGGLMLSEDAQLTLGRLSERQLSSARKSKANYGLFTVRWNFPGLQVALFEHAKLVADNIREDRLQWVDPTGRTDFTDPLDNQDTFVNSIYLQAHYNRIRNFRATAKVKHELFNQRGEQADDKRDRSFFGLITKADYTIPIGANLTVWPKWKSTFKREVPTDPAQANIRELEETLFLISRYAILEQTWIALGLEFSWFENLRDRPAELQVGFTEDFTSRVYSILFSNTSAYLGYQLTLNAGLQLESQNFEAEDRNTSLGFIRIFASTGQE